MLICPNTKEVFPNDVANVRIRVTTNPATRMNKARTITDDIDPRMPDLAMEPTPWGIRKGDLIHASHASHKPR